MGDDPEWNRDTAITLERGDIHVVLKSPGQVHMMYTGLVPHPG